MPMRAERLGWLSVILASSCCVLPLLAIALGLGSIGLGPFFGRFEPWLDLGGVVLVVAAWFYFLRERRRLYALGSTIKGERRTIVALSVATVLVMLFGGPALVVRVLPSSLRAQATVAPTDHSNAASPSSADAASSYLRKVLAVKGMDCYACVPKIEHSLGKVSGVHLAAVDLNRQTVTVEYDPAEATPDALVNAVKAAGYDAKIAD